MYIVIAGLYVAFGNYQSPILFFCVFSKKSRWRLKLQFDQNSIIINYKVNDNFKNHVVYKKMQEKHKNNF